MNDVIRTLRGYYTWGGGDDVPAPTSQRAKLRYKRFTMRDLWPAKDRFDWTILDAELDRAVRNGQQYALRLRDLPGEGVGVPDWIVQLGLTVASTTIDTNKPISVPKYASASYQALQRQFIQTVADHCEQRNPGLLALVDIGMLGRWGEGHFWGIRGQNGVDGTAYWMPPIEVQRQLVEAHIAAFLARGIVLATLTEPEDMATYAMARSEQITWRRDSLGNKRFAELKPAYRALLIERAKTTPAIVEFFGPSGGGTDVALARQQAAEFGVSLVSNGNLPLDWTAYSLAEQTALLGIGADIIARTPVAPIDPLEALRTEIAGQGEHLARLAQLVADQGGRLAAVEGQEFIAQTTIERVRPAIG
jgi:hypothetical protein